MNRGRRCDLWPRQLQVPRPRGGARSNRALSAAWQQNGAKFEVFLKRKMTQKTPTKRQEVNKKHTLFFPPGKNDGKSRCDKCHVKFLAVARYVALRVQDCEASARFYCEACGMIQMESIDHPMFANAKAR